MAISVNKIYTNVSSAVKKYSIKAFDAIPTMQIKGKAVKALDWAGKEISSAENRLILGVTALASQPFIDLHNKKVDERTRTISCAKTLAKIIVGTLTGVVIRKGCIKAVQKFPKVFDPKFLKKIECVDANKYKQYQNAMGTVLGIFVMLYTNFAIDMPLTKYLTNYFSDKFQKRGKK